MEEQPGQLEVKKEAGWLKPAAILGAILATIILVAVGISMEISSGWYVFFGIIILLGGGLIYFGFDIFRKIESLNDKDSNKKPRSITEKEFKDKMKERLLFDYMVNIKDVGPCNIIPIGGDNIGHVVFEISPRIQGSTTAHCIMNLHYPDINTTIVFENLDRYRIEKIMNKKSTHPAASPDVERRIETDLSTGKQIQYEKKSKNLNEDKKKPKEDLK